MFKFSLWYNFQMLSKLNIADISVNNYNQQLIHTFMYHTINNGKFAQRTYQKKIFDLIAF